MEKLPRHFYIPRYINPFPGEIYGTYPCSICIEEDGLRKLRMRLEKIFRRIRHLVDVTEMKSVSSLEGYNSVVIGDHYCIWEG